LVGRTGISGDVAVRPTFVSNLTWGKTDAVLTNRINL